MITADAGSREKVEGRSRDIAAVGPSPGRTPTRVPRSTPIKQKSKFVGVSRTDKPRAIFCRKSIPTLPLFQ
jgi:hypothetical protein